TDFLGDYGDCITRVRRLRDGRLIATGVARPAGPLPRGNSRTPESGEPVVMFSRDEAKTWETQRIGLGPDQRGRGAWDEWDCAELAGGGRRTTARRRPARRSPTRPRPRDPAQPGRQVRWQG